MNGNVLTLRIRRGKDKALTVDSDIVQQPRQVSSQAPASLTGEPVSLTSTLHDSRTSMETVLLDLAWVPGAAVGGVAELRIADSKRKLLFTLTEGKGKAPVSVAAHLQSELGLAARQTVTVTLKDPLSVQADLIELLLKDIHLARGDMWTLASTLVGSCLYSNQKLKFVESIRTTVSTIYRDGRKVFSAYIGPDTKVVFRSESARLVFLVQITQETYNFQEDGEVLFHKIVNSLFPSIFRRWRDEGTHHLITIVFAANLDFGEGSWTELKEGQRPSNTKDFYRVVVDQVNIVHWNEIMISLRYEFVNFRRDIFLQLQRSARFLPTIKSDILNTINLATTLVVDRFRDPDLRHTTTHFILISAGNGLFDVEYDDLLDTGKRLLNSELSVDIVCLSPPPLHASPLFRYRDNMGSLHHCVPGWIDVSYWTEENSRQLQWYPRCKIYELQMMGVMENEMSAVSVVHLDTTDGNASEMMDAYDKSVFSAEVSQMKPSLPKLVTKSSLRWQVSANSPVAKAQVDPISPVFTTFEDGAILSLRNIGMAPQEKLTKSSDDTNSIESVRSVTPTPRPKISRTKTTRMIASASTPQQSQISSVESLKAIMWTEISNPSKQLTQQQIKSLSVGKWQDVFPKLVKRRSIKWRSLSSPSELPVTTPLFPTVEDFENNFTFQTHSVTLSPELEKYMTLSDLLRDMIYLRLMLGFQICYGENVNKVEDKTQSEGDSSLLFKHLVPGTDMTGARVYLSIDEQIHRISCDYDGSITVQRYTRVHTKDFFRNSFNRVMIKTRYQNTYHPYDPDPVVVKPRRYRWNSFDQRLAGLDDEDGDSGYKTLNRLKFVLLPADVPKSTYLISNDKQDMLTPEETRVEGLRRLITTLHRGTFTPEGHKKSTKEEIFPEINFYTGDLISFLKEQANEIGVLSTPTAETLNKTVSLAELAAELRGPKGVKLTDRRWHWKVHNNCFRGVELVNWLLDNFGDISTRDDAVAYGNELMNEGLFVHVENRHKFLDGHYFYRIVYEVPKEEPLLHPRSRSASVGSKGSKSSKQFTMTPVINASDELDGKKHTFVLSRALKFDLDPGRNSYRKELMTVHYDTVHNPNHCFHIRLEWLTATPKLVEDTVNSWLRMCERYGLKLVETPWGELREVPRVNPFHSFVDIKLAINPWEDPDFADTEVMKKHRFFYHIYLLEHSGFLMDNRASMFFLDMDDGLDIQYSWGSPIFKYAQYIHKTGAYMAEIREDGDLFLAPNNMHIARVNVGNVSSQQQAPNFVLDSQKIMLQFRATCMDARKLRKVFMEGKLNQTSMNNSTTLIPVDDLTI